MISIIVPVYNVENYIKRCIDSVLRQTYKDFELIIIDDGSGDKSPEICKEYGNSDSRVRYIRKENEGIAITRFKAMQYVTGEYFCFLDSDDYLSDDCLEKLLQNMDDSVDCVIGQQERFGNLDMVKQVKWDTGVFLLDDGHKRFADEFINNKHGNELWNKLYRTSAAKEAWKFPVNLKYGSDLIYSILYLNKCRAIKCIEDVTYFYEYRQGSVARSSEKTMVLHSFVDVIKKTESYLPQDDSMKKMFSAVAGQIFAIALTKYKNADNGKERTIEDIEALSDDKDVLRYAKTFLKHKKYLKSFFNTFPADYYQVLGFYESVLHGDAWYYTRLYPARLENNKKAVLKAKLNKILGRVKK